MAAVVIVSAVAASINTLVGALNAVSNYTKENRKLSGEYERGLEFMRSELKLVRTEVLEWEGQSDYLLLQLEEHLSDMDDYLSDLATSDNFTRAYKDSVEPYLKKVAEGLTLDLRPCHIQRMLGYLERLQSILKRKTATDKKDTPSLLPAILAIPSCPLDSHLDIGFQARLIKLKELLSPDGGTLRRICIVGCRGIGKTCLARKMFEAAESQDIAEVCFAGPYEFTWWIQASRCRKVEDFLDEISKCCEAFGAVPRTLDSVKKILFEKRFLIVIDDLWSADIKWKELEDAFPDNRNDSRILVTTTDQSVSRDFCSRSYFVYPLSCLTDSQSEELFWRRLFGDSSRPKQEYAVVEASRSREILAKCQGLPSAIIRAVDYLSSNSNYGFMSPFHTEEACYELSNIISSDKREFQDLKRVYLHCYSILKNQDERNCLLYFSLYPQGFKIRLKYLARKLKAESLVQYEDSVERCLKKLVEIGMVMNNGSNYQLQGLMLEFIICKALSKNMLTLVDKGKVRLDRSGQNLNKCRRLSSHGSNSFVMPQDVDLSALRSLTILSDPADPTSIDELMFKSYTFMRVLELAGCQGFRKKSVLRSICELRLLKYLSLRRSDVSYIPKEVKNLKQLETFDLRNTVPLVLPVEVLILPALTYLFGVFTIPSLGGETTDVTEFLIKHSRLHTLEGLYIGDTCTFDIVIRNATNLRRIKLCEDMDIIPSAAGRFSCFSGQPTQEIVIERLIRALHHRRQQLDFICIESSNISKAFLELSMRGCTLRSLKLKGKLLNLPLFEHLSLTSLGEISLYNTQLCCGAIVAALQNLRFLEKLKLGKEYRGASWGGVFRFQTGTFLSLRELWFKGPQYVPRVVFEEGSMGYLASLMLLCPYKPTDDHEMKELAESMERMAVGNSPTTAMKVQGLEHLRLLDEVILHQDAHDVMVKVWERAAKSHPNMPYVTRQGAQSGANVI